MLEAIKRQTAYKLRIGDLSKGKSIMEEGRLRFVELGDRQIYRVNIIANIIDRYASEGEKKYLFFTIDDASGQIRLKIFGEDIERFKDITQGNSVRVIGTIKAFNNENYISPEIIKVVDPRHLLVRKLELDMEKSQKPVDKKEIIAIKDRIIEMVKNAESEGGLEADKIIMAIDTSPQIINQEITRLLEEGVLYEPRPGKIRFLG
ncbi:OB-fold nucleic acid binding domain-containing protein [Candidatus Pacearchaeota archaeon]|nr:OB-fold nucleic acid binding domain-containing protein [Candidatus Pacearchaeota archaeon]